MDSLDTCVKLEMTKTGAVPGQWRIDTSSGHTSSNYLLFVVDWCTLDFGSVFHGVAGAAALRSHQSGSGER